MNRIDDVARIVDGYIGDYEDAGLPTDPEYIALALDDAGHLLPDLPEPEGYVDAVSADGVIDKMAYWGHRVDVEAMRDPRRKGYGAITVFGVQAHNPLELAHQLLAACNYINENSLKNTERA